MRIDGLGVQVPVGLVADGAENPAVEGGQLVERALGHGGPHGLPSRAADGQFAPHHLGPGGGQRGLGDLDCLGHHFRPDIVAKKNAQMVAHGAAALVSRKNSKNA